MVSKYQMGCGKEEQKKKKERKKKEEKGVIKRLQAAVKIYVIPGLVIQHLTLTVTFLSRKCNSLEKKKKEIPFKKAYIPKRVGTRGCC